MEAPAGGPAGRPRRNDLDGAEHRRILEGRRSGGISGCLLSGKHLLIAGRGHHLAGRVPAAGVIVVDPGTDPGPGLCPGGEVLDPPELEFDGGVPGLDDRVPWSVC